jgi:hypothetical protein
VILQRFLEIQMTTSPAISLTDLIAIQNAFLTLYSLADEVHLNPAQFERKLDCVHGRVVLDRVMSSLNAKFEVTA